MCPHADFLQSVYLMLDYNPNVNHDLLKQAEESCYLSSPTHPLADRQHCCMRYERWFLFSPKAARLFRFFNFFNLRKNRRLQNIILKRIIEALIWDRGLGTEFRGL